MKKPILFLFVLAIAFACKKEDPGQGNGNACPTTNQTSNINSSDLLNCKYISGTYWLYIDSVNLQTDSTYIDIHNSGFTTDGCNNSYQAHSFGTISIPSMNTESYSVVPGGLFKNVTGVNSGTQIYSDYVSALSFSNYSVTKLDSMFVFDQFYFNVLEVTIDNDTSEENDKSVYYINSDFGILRHEIYENSILISNRILTGKNIVR